MSKIDAVQWQYRVMYDITHARRDEWCDWHDAGNAYYEKIKAEIAAGRSRVQVRELYTAPPAKPVSVETIARKLDPKAFDDDPVVRHRHCSPMKVEFVQEKAIAKARSIHALIFGGGSHD